VSGVRGLVSFPNGKQAYSRVPITPLFPGFSMFFVGNASTGAAHAHGAVLLERKTLI